MSRDNILFVLSAPSGAGKSTLIRSMMERDPRLTHSISYTSRPPRGKEIAGVDYYFTSKQDFEQRIARGEFLEHATVFGNHYGTHRGELERANANRRDLVLDIDVQGARQLIKGDIPGAVYIFILPPDRPTLESRLRSRGEDSPEAMERRLKEAADEIRCYRDYNYILINGDLTETLANLEGIIRAERCRRERVESQVAPIVLDFERRS